MGERGCRIVLLYLLDGVAFFTPNPRVRLGLCSFYFMQVNNTSGRDKDAGLGG